MRFTRHGHAVRAKVDGVEAQILGQLATALLQLIEPPSVAEDPLAELVGLPDGDVTPPDNPVLERLLPDAYGDDPEAAQDFRRYTDGELRKAKRAAAQLVLTTLPEEGGKLTLDRAASDAWLTCLNDMRLALGTSLEVTEDTDLDDDSPPQLGVYHWLGYLQESLLSCLEPQRP